MERSPELEAVARRWVSHFAAGDVEAVLATLSGDEKDGLLWVGTDPTEEWRGRVVIDRVIRAQFEEMGGSFPFRLVDVIGWSEGTVGWTYNTMVLEIEPEPVLLRFTAVYHLELGSWKMVHAITAIPTGNAEALGVELTTSVDLIAQAVEVERPDLSSVTTPEGTVTLLFTDIEGSTERNAVLGDREWMMVLRRHHDLIRQQTVANGGFEVKSMGDGFMLAFSSARRALQCALDIQRVIDKEPDLDVRVRAGLHAGEAVRVGDDFYGGVVNMAARVAGQASGGEVLASSLVKGLVETSGEFTFADPREAELKGFPGTHTLHPVLL